MNAIADQIAVKQRKLSVTTFISPARGTVSMRSWAHKTEVVVDKLIPLALAALLAMIAAEIFWPRVAEEHQALIQWADWGVLAVFALDVFFKFKRARSVPHFLRTSWVDIIAIFPFFLVFRLFEGLLGLIGLSETAARSQQILHASIEVEKEAELALKEGSRFAAELSEATRAEKLSKFLEPIARSTRLFILGDPHVRKDVEKEADKLKREGLSLEKAGKGLGRRIEKTAEREEKVLRAAIFYEKPGLMHHHLSAGKKIRQDIRRKDKRQGRHFY